MKLTTLCRSGCALGLLLATLVAQAQTAMAAGPHATRTGMAFGDREEALLQAQRDHQSKSLGQMLGDDFQMVVAQDGGAIVPREDWLEAAVKPGAADWVVSQLTTHVFGDLVQVSFVLRPSPPKPGTLPLAVVDTWQKTGENWRLAVRHVANAAGPRKGIPGDAPTRAVIKKY